MEKFIFCAVDLSGTFTSQRYTEDKQMDTTEIELLKITETNEHKSKEVKLFLVLRG